MAKPGPPGFSVIQIPDSVRVEELCGIISSQKSRIDEGL
jgi:hypothetical protein